MNISEERNNLILKAWNEWKDICSILGCSTNNKELLLQEVGNAFRKKILFYCHEDLPILKGRDSDHDETKHESENKIFAHEFDIALELKAKIPGVNKHTGKEKEKKYYKDIAWQAMEQSHEPPLKIIRGMLLGGTGNYGAPLNMVVLEFLEKNYGYQYITDMEKKSGLVKPLSMNASVEGEDGAKNEFGDFIADLCTQNEMQPTDQHFLEKEIPSLLTTQEMAVLLAERSNVALTNNDLLQFIRLNKTAAYNKLREAHGKLLQLLKDNFDPDDMPHALEFIIRNIIIPRLETEKASDRFLYAVYEKSPELKD